MNLIKFRRVINKINEHNSMIGVKTIKQTATILLSTFSFTGLMGQGAYLPPEKPKLIIGIVVEQLRYDQLEKFRSRFCENG
ncbi:MAG: hypothetical protein NTZ85_00775, partial [Bacteroidia bacterium]|nr:hypothetical protein [Bacteroidia bacterium]